MKLKKLIVLLPLLTCGCAAGKFDKGNTFVCKIDNYTCRINCQHEDGVKQTLGTANRAIYAKITYLDVFLEEKTYLEWKFSLYCEDNFYYHYDNLYFISGFESNNQERIIPLEVNKLVVSGTKIDFNHHKFYAE